MIRLLALLLSCSSAYAASITLAWDRSPDPGIGEYLIYWGVTSGVYPNVVSAGTNLIGTVSGLNPGARYYFVAKAKNTNQVESDPSNEVTALAPGVDNQRPVIGDIRDVTNSLSTVVAFTVDDPDGTSSLTLMATSSNPGLVPNENIVFMGIGTNRTMIITPAPRQIGRTTITITLSDGLATATRTFLLTIRSPLSPGNLQLIASSTTNQPMVFDGISTTLDFGDVDPLGGVTNGVVVLWLQMSSQGGPWGGIVTDIDVTGSYGWAITRGASNYLHIVSRAGDMGSFDTGPIVDDAWVHVAVSFARNPHVWIGGVEVPLTSNGPFPISPALNTVPLRFGIFRDQYYFKGRLENVAIYTNAVPIADIQGAAADLSHRTVPPGYYVLYQ